MKTANTSPPTLTTTAKELPKAITFGFSGGVDVLCRVANTTRRKKNL